MIVYEQKSWEQWPEDANKLEYALRDVLWKTDTFIIIQYIILTIETSKKKKSRIKMALIIIELSLAGCKITWLNVTVTIFINIESIILQIWNPYWITTFFFLFCDKDCLKVGGRHKWTTWSGDLPWISHICLRPYPMLVLQWRYFIPLNALHVNGHLL